ncbi:MAG TPA: DUF6580 family putative transport protein [Patescibacteria group bacterium]
MKIKNIFNPILFIALAVILRLIPHIPNVAPIAAMALFGGVYLNKKYALIVPIIAMMISDIFLGFHNTMIFVYGSFILTGLIGLYLRNHKNIATVIAASVTSSILFFLITNFGVWLMSGMYAKTLTGLMDAYVMGIPFFRNTVLGDLSYVGILFGSYEFALRIMPKLSFSKK